MDPIPLRNAALDRMRSGDVALGMIVRLHRSGDIALIAKSTGHDFLFLDLQHGLLSLEAAGQISLAALGCGIATLVRLPGPDNPDAQRLLDAGAMGIIVPDVETAEDARRAVVNCKFAPVGKRSVSSGYPAFGYGTLPLKQATEALNRTTLVVCMIETRKGLQNIEAIAQVDGVDVLHMGCNDLLSDIGKPGQFGSPEIVEAIERLIAACAKNGKYAGLGGDKDPERQSHFIKRGVRFVTTHSDVAFLIEAASKRTASLRSSLA